jgi:hypothetical protein
LGLEVSGKFLIYYQVLPTATATSALGNAYKGKRLAGRKNRNWTKQFETTANYTFKNNTHLLRGVAGYSFTENISESMSMTNYDFAFDQFLYNSIGSGSWLAAGKAGMSSNKSSSRLVGLFGRVNYSWNALLTATASLRYEGSSRFGVNKKWGYFPASPRVGRGNMVHGRLKVKTQQFESARILWGNRTQAGSNSRSNQTYLHAYLLFMDGLDHGLCPSKNANYASRGTRHLTISVSIFEIFRGRGSVEYFDPPL